MQPMGRKPVRFPSKTDHHVKGHRNWWEDMSPASKRTDRQAARRSIAMGLEWPDK